MSNSGSFQPAQKALADKAMRALFKLKGLLHSSNIKPSVSMKLFEQLIQPICLYGSELWGAYSLKTVEHHKFIESMEKLACEKLNMSFCRFLLGVHKKAQQSAIRGELGRAPLAVDIIANMMKYNDYLEAKDKKSILHEALMVCKTMPDSTTHSKYWVSQITQIQQILANATNNNRLDMSNRKSVKKCLVVQYSESWLNKIKQERKMRTYIQFKTSFVSEDYLSIKNELHRKAMSKLRISAHTLQIERGRYTTPPTPVEKRTCQHCPENQVEDEYHFLITCNKFSTARANLYSTIDGLCDQFKKLDNYAKFMYMLSAGVEVAEHVAAFIYENLP